MGSNFYSYGLKASATSFEAAFRYVHQQGLAKLRVGLEEMFEESKCPPICPAMAYCSVASGFALRATP
jgi:hypothetical protein